MKQWPFFLNTVLI